MGNSAPWYRNKWLQIAVLVALVGVPAAWSMKRAPEVYVQCAPSLAGIHCSLTSKSGGPAHACWDWVATCANSKRVQAHGCGDVDEGGVSSQLTPNSDVLGVKDCDVVAAASLKNLTITAR